MELSRLEIPRSYSIRYEQYVTSPDIAARMVYQAFLDGHIMGKTVVDLGCGNGILSVAAALLGAASVSAYDIDEEMVRVATRNSRDYPISVHRSDVKDINSHFDTVLMNPPWGSSSAHADLPFIEKAGEIADHIYAIHNSTTEEFLDRFYGEMGTVRRKILVSIDIPRIYPHHTKKSAAVSGIIYCVDVKS
ncbi:MAG: METTL5 family protein [Thermoplasmata archaeon]